jgi:hypothetical protein
VPKYFPIDAGVDFECVNSDLLKVHWTVDEFTALFALPDNESKALCVRFDSQAIVRILDEMPLSTEDDPAERHGMVSNHFAYRVEGAPFAAMQSVAWKEVVGPVEHYLLVTGWGCVDVLTAGKPAFEVVKIQR